VREDTYSVGSLRKSYPQSLDPFREGFGDDVLRFASLEESYMIEGLTN
jgi:hypothetical protein